MRFSGGTIWFGDPGTERYIRMKDKETLFCERCGKESKGIQKCEHCGHYHTTTGDYVKTSLRNFWWRLDNLKGGKK